MKISLQLLPHFQWLQLALWCSGLLFSSGHLMGQSQDDSLQIQETIRHYFEEQVAEDYYYMKNMTSSNPAGEIVTSSKDEKQLLENGALLPLTTSQFFSNGLRTEAADRPTEELLELSFLFFDPSGQSALIKARHKDSQYCHYIDLKKKSKGWKITQVFWSRE